MAGRLTEALRRDGSLGQFGIPRTIAQEIVSRVGRAPVLRKSGITNQNDLLPGILKAETGSSVASQTRQVTSYVLQTRADVCHAWRGPGLWLGGFGDPGGGKQCSDFGDYTSG